MSPLSRGCRVGAETPTPCEAIATVEVTLQSGTPTRPLGEVTSRFCAAHAAYVIETWGTGPSIIPARLRTFGVIS